ncbi:MAG: putative replication origin-binding protein [Prokaryotic dsDNA virus sp.]|nr:MAG: putative replication origin-binding protein [Prokaryotic dsDNA virus sp.]
MPTIDIVVECEVERTVRLRQVSSMFEMEETTNPSERWSFDIDLPEEWQIGLIVGPSGSGKTTLAELLFSNDPTDQYRWPEKKCLLDGFPTTNGTSIKGITQTLTSVGFSSPPSWLKPYNVLSTGEQFRANLARAVHELRERPQTVVDEFTSTVDRTVARIGSAAVSKAVRRTSGQFVAVTCHNDVEEWLQPDWVIEMPSGTLTHRRLVRRPDIDLDIKRCHHSRWATYRKHHYLSHTMNRAAHCYEATWNGQPVAFMSVLYFPHPVSPGWRGHRIVCLPDYQGIGIGMGLANYVAGIYAATGLPYRTVATHPALIAHRNKSPLWALTRKPSTPRPLHRKKRGGYNRLPQSAMNRLTATHQYIGPPNRNGCKLFGLEPA